MAEARQPAVPGPGFESLLDGDPHPFGEASDRDSDIPSYAPAPPLPSNSGGPPGSLLAEPGLATLARPADLHLGTGPVPLADAKDGRDRGGLGAIGDGVSRRNLLLAAGAGTAAVAGAGAFLLRDGAAAAGSGQAFAAGAPQAGAGMSGGSTAAAAGAASSAGAAGSSGGTSSAGTAGAALPSAPVAATVSGSDGRVLKLSRKLDPDLLIRRVTYGATPEVVREVKRLGAQAWLARQLAPGKIKDPGGDDIVRRFPSLGWSVDKTRASIKDGEWKVMQDLVAAHLGRAIWSQRQVKEVMVDFWSNHLNVTCPSGDVWDTRHRYDADVIRKHALGTFENMLLASAFHPSMLIYLNNAQSTKDAPNENYARELLELHTVGVKGGYTERDVKRSALLLTGWKVEKGKAIYDPSRHYVGTIKVMGFTHSNKSAAKGVAAQKAYIRYLARHPKTAMYIARKLAVQFVSDKPSAALVKHLAKVYSKHKTAIVPVLRALFSSEEFATSGGDKVRRPFERLVASARALGVKPGKDSQGITDLYYTLKGAGHQPLGWPMPDGYPNDAGSWQSPASALEQFNTTTSIVHGWYPQKLALPGPKKLLKKPPTTRTAMIDAVGRKVLGRKPTAREAAAARTLLAGTKLPTSFKAGTYQQEETLALIATLFLSSPAHFTR